MFDIRPCLQAGLIMLTTPSTILVHEDEHRGLVARSHAKEYQDMPAIGESMAKIRIGKGT